MARSLLLNSRPVAGPIAITAGQPIALVLVLTDADATVGDEWAASVTGGGLTFTQPIVQVPAGATSPTSLLLEAPGGFTQAGGHQINIRKIAGAGANPTTDIWTIDFQVTAAAVQQVPPQTVATQPQPAPVATPAQPAIPQPLQVQLTGAGGGAWVNGLSIGVVIASIAFLLVFGWIVYQLMDAMSLSGQMNAVSGTSSQEGILIENYDITLTAKPGGRIVAGDDPTTIVNGITASTTPTH